MGGSDEKLHLSESMRIEEIMEILSRLSIKDSNQRLLAEVFIGFMRRVGDSCGIHWCCDKYIEILENKLRKYKRLDRQVIRKLWRKRHFHPITELQPLRDLIWGIDIQTNIFAKIIKDLMAVLNVAVQNITSLMRSPEYPTLRRDLSWLNDCNNYFLMNRISL